MYNVSEKGRSMVEMLGVLAVIGVLSVMGIKGYQRAMLSYKANEIVNSVSMLAVAAQTCDASALPLTWQRAYGLPVPSGIGSGPDRFVAGRRDKISMSFENIEICLAVYAKLSGPFSSPEGCQSNASMTIVIS